ncbi:MAG: transposase [Pyrinomonadaceae bacterium]
MVRRCCAPLMERVTWDGYVRSLRLKPSDRCGLRSSTSKSTTQEFQQQYAARAGIEATHEQAIRCCGLRQSRYIGMAKTHLQHVLTETAINVV